MRIVALVVLAFSTLGLAAATAGDATNLNARPSPRPTLRTIRTGSQPSSLRSPASPSSWTLAGLLSA